MRKLLIIGGAVLFAAVPVLAQPPAVEPPPPTDRADDEGRGRGDDRIHEDERDYDDAADYAPLDEELAAVADPREVARMGVAMDRLLGAVMDLPIGGIVEAVDPYGRSGYRRGDTVRDMASRDDHYFEERLRAGIRGSTRSVAVMSRALARMMPVMQESIREVERSVEEALDESRPDERRYRRRR
jgi:hypothetical protein